MRETIVPDIVNKKRLIEEGRKEKVTCIIPPPNPRNMWKDVSYSWGGERMIARLLSQNLIKQIPLPLPPVKYQ
jgi:hypothetical protein